MIGGIARTQQLNKWKSYLRNIHWDGELLYLIAYGIYLISVSLDTTMFVVPMMLGRILRYTPVLILAVKMIAYDRWEKRAFVYCMLLMLLAVLIVASSGYLHIFFLMLFIIEGRDVEFTNLVKLYLILKAAVISITVIASQLGIITDLLYERSYRGLPRHSLGFSYTTDCAAHFFFWYLAWIYLLIYANRYELKTIVVGIVACIMLLVICDARTSVIGIGLGVLGYGYAWRSRMMKPSRLQRGRKALYKLAVISIPLMVTISFGLIGICRLLGWQMKDSISMGSFIARLNQGLIAFENYQLKPFGQYMPMQGAGGSVGSYIRDYFFLDCSYVNILFCYGIIFAILLVMGFMMVTSKVDTSVEWHIVIIILSIMCVSEHHLIEFAYNVFILQLGKLLINNRREGLEWTIEQKR